MDDRRIVAYFLGELTEEESERFEDECFASNGWPDEIRTAEHDLVDAYLRKELIPEQRKHFEQNYLTTPKRLEQVAAAAVLLGHVENLGKKNTSEQRPIGPTWINSLLAIWRNQSWAMRAGLAVGVVAVVVAALWLARSRISPPRNFATLTLTIVDSNRAEGAQAHRLKLSPGVDALRIQLKLPDAAVAASRYRVDLENEEGEKIPVNVTGEDAETITVEVLANQLKREQHALRLFAVRSDGAEQRVSGFYYFIIE